MPACGACGVENPAGSRFCGACGAPLEARCPSCGEAYEPDPSARFCRNCGAQLAAPTSPQAQAAPAASTQTEAPGRADPVAERRVCSVLFADLVGFTPLSETKDAEEVREILSRYFEVARRLVGRYGGTVEKFIGDAVMAVWGTPVAYEADAERAVRAALDLVEAVKVLGDELGAPRAPRAANATDPAAPDSAPGAPNGAAPQGAAPHRGKQPGLSARVGVVTGEVAVTIGAVGEGMVAGDAVNTAARVQATAQPGCVLVDDTTRRQAERAIAFEDVGLHELKGKESPEHLFRAVRVLAGRGGTQRSDALEAPFTGRDAELRAVKDLFDIATERRTPRLVVVTGPAGVGKSRLGWEFEKYADGIAETVLWHRGRCLSYGEGVAFWALAEAVRQRFGIAEEDAPEVASTKLQEGLVRFVPDPAERDYVGLRLSRLLGVAYPSETRAVLGRDELFAGWRLFIERLAAVAPVIMLIEDAQYADEGLLAFLEHLVDWTRDLPILVLLFARPGLAAIDSGYGMGRNRSTLSLDPLDRASMGALVGSLVPGMPQHAVDTIVGRSQGIPLFAVETVRSLIDQGIVVRDDDGYHLASEIGELAVPESLHALLAARLDALPADLRSLVADAAVIGTTFPIDALVAVSGRDEPAVSAGVAELVRRDVLDVMADPLSPERGSLRFGQEMLRQVAYDTLSKRDRRSRHLAVAEHLRTTFSNEGDEIAEVIAHHYLDALSADPSADDAAELAADALRFLVRAGERARRSGALSRAAENFGRAAEIAPPDEAPALFESAAQASLDHADSDVAVSMAESAARAWSAVGNERGAARARAIAGQAHRAAGRHGAARAEFMAAIEVLRPTPDADTVRVLEYLGGVELFGGNGDEGERIVTEALTLSQALGLEGAQLASSFTMKGIAAGWRNRPLEGSAFLEFAARLAERAGDASLLSRAQLSLSNNFAAIGDPAGALEAARSAAGGARRAGMRRHLGVATVNEVIALVELGRWHEADQVLRQMLDVEHFDVGGLGGIAGCFAAMRGDVESATAALDRLLAGPETEDEQDLADIGLLSALIADCHGDPDRALAHARGVLERRGSLGISADSQRMAWPIAARAARRTGNRGALAELLEMLASYPPGHLPPVLRAGARLFAALDEADAGGSTPEALASLAEAVDVVRASSYPYELAHALCDWADVLVRHGDEGAPATVSSALDEARRIGESLGCRPLLARVAAVEARRDFAAAHAGSRPGG